jgi:hypothetical protein
VACDVLLIFIPLYGGILYTFKNILSLIMIKQYRNDIRTIVEILTCLAFYAFFRLNQWLVIGWFILAIGRFSYRYYYRKVNKTDIITFKTLNDDYSKMTFITIGILILIFSGIGFFALSMELNYLIIGLAISVITFLLGYFKPPLGWLLIENNALKIYGVQGEIDSRQLKEIILKNDQIILTNIYGEHKNSNLLNLNPIIAENIKSYINEKLNNSEVSVVNDVQ